VVRFLSVARLHPGRIGGERLARSEAPATGMTVTTPTTAAVECVIPSVAHVYGQSLWDLTFDMSGGPKGAKRPLGRPLDGGVRFLIVSAQLGRCAAVHLRGRRLRSGGGVSHW
jgi:hypothetical protein